MIKKLLFAGSLVAGSLSAIAQETSKEFITDRPDATESPRLVPHKSFQVETGFLYENYGEKELRLNNYTYSTTLLRYGLLENLELRLGADLFQSQPGRSSAVAEISTGFSPLLAGVKIGVAEENGWLPEIGFLGHLYLPFSVSEEYRPESTGVDFRFAFSNNLSDRSALSYNLGAAWAGAQPAAVYLYTVSYSYSLTSGLGAYAELYGEIPEAGMAAHFCDAGLTYAIQDNLQLDALAGFGINNEQNLMLGAGLSFRLPN
ncbi:transporter [Zunongwangia sp. H14]|uniref:transporter n=1 Tax=Zunongwangia sp. H14 TaxID=3240792 RepID=UPI00356B436B